MLAGLSWSKIASEVKNNPSSDVAKAIVGTANYITAAICKMTGNQPASACTSTIQSLEKQPVNPELTLRMRAETRGVQSGVRCRSR